MSKLLFVTQVMDKSDSVLGAYHGWVSELAKHVGHITVICLYEGEHTLPSNVRVFSLGKERGRAPAFVYALRFLALVWRLRRTYDTVFVHMNQEYLLLAGVTWKLLGKRIFFWRNHYAGSVFTDMAALFCTKIFCTSRYSYTAKYKNTEFMPVGVDTSRFLESTSVARIQHSILFFARMAPAKRPELFIEALGLLKQRGVSFTASLYGSPLPVDVTYYENLKIKSRELGLEESVIFYPEVPNSEAPAVFAAHEIFVNCSPSGMFDKTLFEAVGAGCVVLARSLDFCEQAGSDFHFETCEELAHTLEGMLVALPSRASLTALLERNSLKTLGLKLSLALEKPYTAQNRL